MKKILAIFAIVAVLAVGALGVTGLGLFGWGKSTYNGMVASNNNVDAKWAQVQNVYQRRSDLIPNLVETVKGVASFEKDTFVGVAAARASVGAVRIDKNNAPATAEELQKFQNAQTGLSSALSRLMVVAEKYPDLKANQNFIMLQTTLEGTENRISVERREFNLATQAYNTQIQSFPANVLAGYFNFQAKPLFQAEAGTNVAPKISFKE